ncbi:septal ring lytic transglycosylase RlpA family protein [Chlorobium sp. N1]|uniref:septal ring lytic transglycosylase RlpA family protein n=1 Tax=Chlorobium sp. N1 TaxID=2491138 RepID=UPI00103C47DA|nr:septal ring lytic transglycosylase RlpA family protein [Chlorobium sp. N1]TCD48156.1 septal ring lytic transglycosylase RlpA family protein [Chlorobium sp. N1]
MTPKAPLAACLVLTLALSSCSSTRRSFEREEVHRISPEEAYRLGKLKNTPYVIDGRIYVPMSYEQAAAYEEVGRASWYGRETLAKNNHQPTAYGEPFDPSEPSAAHKYLPLPSRVRVTNLENSRSIVVRVNDRGPFVDDRVIDLSAAAAKELGFYQQGTAKVKVEVLNR